MKVYYLLLVSAICVWITPTRSQFFYSHYTPLSSPIFSQTFLPTLPAVSYTPRVASTSSITYNIPNIPTVEYRGFGYRTDYKDGASSTVFYVTGPEAQHLRSFKDFPSFARKLQEPMPGKARSLASDLTDINAIPDANQKIQNILQPADFDRLFDAATPGVVNFYSFPAGTVPLALARQLNTTNVTTTTPSSKEEEHEAAESVVSSKVVINAIDNMIKSNGTTSENTTTTTAKAVESSTEAKLETTTAFLVNVEDEDTTTNSNEEITTQV
ncbi:uncharacterized protein LOC123006720 [Tribolium madens]|uniref:uncharacterized protein LOC123006720 n=1 Tax=Tribolium madens TaxID=41895 RepID=UPI001CF73A64|nr:uncharacterized protein LOC123006720 [Tribolium madens]